MDTSYWMLRFLRSPNAAKAREVLGIGEGDDGGETPTPPGGGDVVGPGSSTAGHIASYGDGTGTLLADSGIPASQTPSAGQKAALAGTNGTPSGANPYVTNSDPRNSDSRTPDGAAGGVLSGSYPNPGFAVDMATQAELDAVDATALGHATRHSAAGADPVTITNLAGFPGGGTTFLRDDATWATPGGGGSGTVTSVALTAPSILSVAGSPVTTAGSLDLTLANQNVNLVFAGPASGGAAAPTFRSIVAADLPSTAQAWTAEVSKSADQTVNGATLVNDTELVIALSANSFYEVEMALLYSAPNATGDFDWQFTHPDLVGSVGMGFFVFRSASLTLGLSSSQGLGTTTLWPAAETRFGTDAASADAFMIGRMHFWLRTDVNAGNLQFQFASAQAGVDATTRAGSTLRVKRLG